MGIAQSSIEKLKSAPISKVIEGLGSTLKKVGREYVTHCIWHEDTNPSLTINDDKGFCFCHVCRKGGDSISFVRQKQGLDFVDAANLAASILGIEIETNGIDPVEQARLKSERIAALNELTKKQELYRENLQDDRADRIRSILKGRGIEPTTSKEFGLGYAASGFFEGRITIPIYNHLNELVGWTGRATKEKERQPAKYKNSSDHPGIFEKKSLIFNEVRAKEAARLAGSLIFVEGHLDVVSLWQHGIANAVAMQGTGAPDKIVLQRLARSVDSFVLCFDGDKGGKTAVQHFIAAAGPMAQRGEVQINVVQLPQGQDPDEVCRNDGAMAFHNLVAEAMPWLDWVIDFWAADLDKSNGAEVTEVEKELRKIIDGLESNALRAHYIDKVSRALTHGDKEARHMVKGWGSRTIEVGAREWRKKSEWETRVAVERRMLRLYIHRPAHREALQPLLTRVQHAPLQWLVDRIKELEEHCQVDLTPHSVMAVVVTSEPYFLQQLRTIVQPNVNIDETPGVLKHCSDTMAKDTLPESYEPREPF